MTLFRRRSLIGGAAAAALAPPAVAQRFRPGKPFAATELKVLCVVATQFRAHEARLPAFTEATGITAKYTYVPFVNMREALTAEMVGGTGDYDLAIAMDQWVPSLTNLFEPADAILRAKGIDTAAWPRAFIDTCTVDGTIYGVPSRGHVQLLFYRKDLFAKHGIAVPNTWEETIEAAKALQAREQMAGLAVPYARNNGQNLMVWYNFLWGRGGSLFDERGQPAFNSAAGLRATEDYIGLLRTHRVVAPAALGFTEQDSVNAMAQGNAAMVPVWWWVRAVLVNPRQSRLTEDQVGFAPLPAFAGAERSTYINCWTFGITRRSRRKEAAAELLAWIADPALERDVLLDPKENDVVGLQWSTLRDPAVNARFGGMHLYAAEALTRTRAIAYTPEWPQVMEALETAMSEAASGTRSVADAMNGAAAQVRRISRRRG